MVSMMQNHLRLLVLSSTLPLSSLNNYLIAPPALLSWKAILDKANNLRKMMNMRTSCVWWSRTSKKKHHRKRLLSLPWLLRTQQRFSWTWIMQPGDYAWSKWILITVILAPMIITQIWASWNLASSRVLSVNCYRKRTRYQKPNPITKEALWR